jgi:hypothetical protein
MAANTTAIDDIPILQRISFTSTDGVLTTLQVYVNQRIRVLEEQNQATTSPSSNTDSSSPPPSNKATIRYIGPVSAAKDPHAIMFGIEWDSMKGKNDGSVSGGGRYFTCQQGYGSFIHPARITTSINICDAIVEKYESMYQHNVTESLYLVADSHTHADESSSRHIPVVFQGEEYMQNKIKDKVRDDGE